VGRGRANLVVLTGRKFSAEEAFALGFAEVVVPHPRLLDETLSLARQIAGNSPEGRCGQAVVLKSDDLDLQSGHAAVTGCAIRWMGSRRPRGSGLGENRKPNFET
jgi:enoyl-CoA hydratase